MRIKEQNFIKQKSQENQCKGV